VTLCCEWCGKQWKGYLSCKPGAHIYCGHRCAGLGQPIIPVAERFWSKVQKRPGEDACWEWTGAPNSRGYGLLFVKGKGRPEAHQVAWYLATGSWPDKCVLHSCDNRLCVRIEVNDDQIIGHLFEGTKADNARDRAAKGRGVMGTRVHTAKLTATDIPIIRSLREEGLSCNAIAKRFGVLPHAILDIVNGTSWKHVPA
jgi:hypothetical protein